MIPNLAVNWLIFNQIGFDGSIMADNTFQQTDLVHLTCTGNTIVEVLIVFCLQAG